LKREIIKIDDEKCTGCGLCIPNCHEGALQIIDGKVRLISELMCDGLGACVGHCPEGAIEIEQREAQPYDEVIVIREMVNKGANTVIAHLKHLKDHNESGYLKQGAGWLKENRDSISFNVDHVISEVHSHGGKKPEDNNPGQTQAHKSQEGMFHQFHQGSGCPGSKERVIAAPASFSVAAPADNPSELRQWPVQMHLINPTASYYRGADMLLAADCVAFSVGSFHSKYLKGHALAIACPKLDHNTEIYVDKLTALIDVSMVNTITVMIMEVPCCGGLMNMVRAATDRAVRKVPVKQIMIGISGEVLKAEWV
jgi:NAD-dependent dihydropyrimidine dehydrogenase PreA subunit